MTLTLIISNWIEDVLLGKFKFVLYDIWYSEYVNSLL